MCLQIPQLNILGFGVAKKILMLRDRNCSVKFSSQHRSLNVLPGASPDSTDNPHYQRLDCHWSVPQPNVSEPQTESLQTKTPPTVSHEFQTEAHIEQILPSPSTYHRKHKMTQKHRRAKKVTQLPYTSTPLDLRADVAIHKEGVIGMDTGGSPRHQETIGGALAHTRSERVLEKPNEPPLPEGHTSRSGEGSMEHTFELMDTVPPTPHDSPLI
ncbi:hypothetical protein Tco_0117819 [Tanacetum coccineum]